jgi:hypothetical protein
VLLAHAGNRIDSADRSEPRFPPSQVAAVRSVVARALAALRPSSVVSAAANGADLIVLDEAQRLGISTHVVLPLPTAVFREESVDATDPSWVDLFHRVLEVSTTASGSSVETHDLRPRPEWYFDANSLILDRAHLVASPGESIVAMTIRPPQGDDPPSATDDFARLASEAGLTVLTLDPRPGRSRALQIR